MKIYSSSIYYHDKFLKGQIVRSTHKPLINKRKIDECGILTGKANLSQVDGKPEETSSYYQVFYPQIHDNFSMFRADYSLERVNIFLSILYRIKLSFLQRKTNHKRLKLLLRG